MICSGCKTPNMSHMCIAGLQVELDDRDMYLIEAETFINAIKTGNTDAIDTLYEDSALSYQASQWITAASKQGRTQGTEQAA